MDPWRGVLLWHRLPRDPWPPSSSRARKKVDNDAKEAESAQRLLEKLPQEVWDKILDELEENDLIPWL